MPDQNQIDGLLRQAAAAREAGDLTDAAALCRWVLRLDPVNAGAVQLLVGITDQMGQPGDALAILDTVEPADPTNQAWPIGRALILTSLGRYPEAVAAYDRAIVLDPNDPASRHAQAAVLFASNRFDDALAGYDAAIALRPDAVDGRLDRAGTLRRLGRHEEALAEYDRIIELQPDSALAHYAKALLLLLLGRYQDGWALHEWRWFTPDFPQPEHLFRQPLWDGTPLDGRTLLVHAEQGLGDSIQFHRFVTKLQRQGPVVMFVPPKLARLFSTQPGAPAIATRTDQLPLFDVHCSLLSLPFLLGNELATLPAAPYLRADPGLAAAWHARLPRSPGQFRVGIAWAGNSAQENDRNRSMTLETMLMMLPPDVTIISLQKDIPEFDRAALRDATQVVDLSDDLTDFAGTAAVIGQLDLVISVCTSAAHLAGALGAPVWVLLSTSADWRWLIGRDDSPWYPSARLFRQDTAGDWSGVAHRVHEALKTLAQPT